MSSEWFIGFFDGASGHTCNLASSTLVIYTPSGQLVASSGACLGPSTNSVVEYSAFIKLFWDATLHGITHLEVRIESKLMVSQLSGDYQVQNPNLLRQVLRVKLFEINFEYISYIHISRNENRITDAYVNYVLDCHLTHTL